MAMLRNSVFKNPARIRRMLLALDTARIPEAMKMSGLRFHALRGGEKGRYAVDPSGN
jgi:hypothetical protein